MTPSQRYAPLFEPIALGPKVMRNRFCQVPHCVGAGSDRPGFQAEFRAMKAEGGWGAVFTEGTSIAPEADVDPYVIVNLWDDGDVRNLSLMCDRVHELDSLAGVELFYGGAPTNSNLSRLPLRAPSQTVTDVNYIGSARAMTKRDIGDVRRMYVDAAMRARAAGYDLITLYAAHAITLLAKFLIPMYNHRTDEYGGSFENRARFAREVAQDVREAVGDDCAVGIRFGVDTLPLPYGLGEQGIAADAEGHRFVAHMSELVDYWDVNISPTSHWGEDAGPSRTHAENHEHPYVQAVKQFTTKPVINVGRFTNPDTMLKVVTSGQCDIIGAARPSIADPFLPNKIRDGRLNEIRECIGCNMCVSKWEQGGPRIICTQNATTGEEFRRGWHPERFTPAANRDNGVLIVGAGPAGMECAVVLGKRQMRRVHLVDADANLGGIMRWVPRLPGLGEWGRVVTYRKVALQRLRATTEFVPKTRMTADDVLDYGADIVVVATGSRWADDGITGERMQPVPGADARLPNVLTPEQVMLEGKQVGKRVVVYDGEGYFMGYSLAHRLVAEGHDVTLVTPHHVISPYSTFTLELPRINRATREMGIEVHTDHVVTAIDGDAVTAESVWTDTPRTIAADSVVLVTQRYSDDRLFRELEQRGGEVSEAGIGGLYQIGDCIAPNFIAEAVFSGHRLAREIDSPDPAVAKPFIRERRLLGGTDEDFALESLSASPSGRPRSEPPVVKL